MLYAWEMISAALLDIVMIQHQPPHCLGQEFVSLEVCRMLHPDIRVLIASIRCLKRESKAVKSNIMQVHDILDELTCFSLVMAAVELSPLVSVVQLSRFAMPF